MLKDLLLFALLPACCGALAVGATLALPGSADAASPRALFSACLINGIAAFTLPGVIQVWFTMGETRRANQERERSAQLETELAETRSQVVDLTAVVADLTAVVADLRRRLDERTPVDGVTPN